jgi:hypothetical protein
MGEYGIKTFHLFLDFKAANDSIDKTQLFKATDKFQTPRKQKNGDHLAKHKEQVKTLSGITDPLDTKKGL